MADSDLDVVIRQLAKQQQKALLAAAKARRDRYTDLAAKAKHADAKARFKHLAKHAMEEGTAIARRLQISADNAADSYARSMRIAGEAPLPKKLSAVKKRVEPKKAAAAKKPAKKKKT